MRRLVDNRQTRRMYDTEPDVFELEEIRVRKEEGRASKRGDEADECYEDAFDCVINLLEEILDAE